MPAHTSFFGQSITLISLSSTWSLMTKNLALALMCLVLFPLDIIPFLIRICVLTLSWYSPMHSALYPCACMKRYVHSISGINMSTVSSSISVELCVFNLTFLEWLEIAPFPIVNIVPPCPLQSQCKLWDQSTYHFSIPKLSMLSFNFRYLVQLRYLSTLFSFPQSSLSNSSPWSWEKPPHFVCPVLLL